jgi:hypothetical protein
VAALQLHVNLGKAVLETVFQGDKSVVDGNDVNDDGNDDAEKNQSAHAGIPSPAMLLLAYNLLQKS